MEKFLKKYFYDNISICRLEKKPNIAIYLSKRQMYKVEMEGFSFVIVEIQAEEQFGIVALKKQKAIYEESLQCNIAFSFQTISKKQRDALIQSKISFIATPEQIYLPFLGIVLSERFKKAKEINVEKMMPVTQQLFLYLLYHKESSVLKSKAADDLGITRTSITRASEQLFAMDLIEQNKMGKAVYMRLKYNPKEAIEKATPYMINPIQSKMTVDKTDFNEKHLYSGETALSLYSMLNPPMVKDVAIYKGNIDIKTLKEVDVRFSDTNSVITIELWKYDPMLFAHSDKVDPVSLFCLLKEVEDERVEMAVEEMMEEYVW